MMRHVVPAGDRDVAFNGELLGRATSEQPGKRRWAEVTLYRTEAGSYVVAGVGRTTVPGEDDRHWAHVSETPQGAIEQLHMYDNDDVRYMPNVSKRALAEAMDRDERLRDAYATEEVA